MLEIKILKKSRSDLLAPAFIIIGTDKVLLVIPAVRQLCYSGAVVEYI